MPHDANGLPLQVGDHANLLVRISEVFPTEEYCNAVIFSVIKGRGNGYICGPVTINTGCLVKVPASLCDLPPAIDEETGLPLWRCHKIVAAAKIVAIDAVIGLLQTESMGIGSGVDIAVDIAYLAKHSPQVGGYFVQYEDGYQSYSPAEAFESGYTSVAASTELCPVQARSGLTGLTFGQALEALKLGARIARAGWNGKGMWLAYSPGVKGLDASKFWAQPNREWALSQPDRRADVLPCITMKTATGEILMGWLASQTDMLSEDWEILS